MANVFCSKCGITGTSKCPHCRTVFSDNKMHDILSYVVKLNREDRQIVILVPDWSKNPGAPAEKKNWSFEESAAAMLASVASHVAEFSSLPAAETVPAKQIVCIHDWQFAEGHESEAACPHAKI